MRALRYVGTAALLGGAWFVVLLAPSMPREWLLHSIPLNLVCLVLASCAVALTFEPWIAKARTFTQHALRAVLLPFAGAFVFLSLFILWTTLTGKVNPHDQVVVLIWGMVSAALAAPVVIPFGFVCQWVMHRLARQPASQT
jgi:hypothetical protein